MFLTDHCTISHVPDRALHHQACSWQHCTIRPVPDRSLHHQACSWQITAPLGVFLTEHCTISVPNRALHHQACSWQSVCWWRPRLWLRIIIIIIIHSFYIALSSALEQTHCAHVACDSEWIIGTYGGIQMKTGMKLMAMLVIYNTVYDVWGCEWSTHWLSRAAASAIA